MKELILNFLKIFSKSEEPIKFFIRSKLVLCYSFGNFLVLQLSWSFFLFSSFFFLLFGEPLNSFSFFLRYDNFCIWPEAVLWKCEIEKQPSKFSIPMVFGFDRLQEMQIFCVKMFKNQSELTDVIEDIVRVKTKITQSTSKAFFTPAPTSISYISK